MRTRPIELIGVAMMVGALRAADAQGADGPGWALTGSVFNI